LGAWSTLAGDALLLDDAAYLPDFSAFVASEAVRMLHLTRGDFLQALEETGLQQQLGQQYGQQYGQQLNEPILTTGEMENEVLLMFGKDDLESQSMKSSGSNRNYSITGVAMQQLPPQRRNSHKSSVVVGSTPLAHSLVERRYYRKQQQAMTNNNSSTSSIIPLMMEQNALSGYSSDNNYLSQHIDNSSNLEKKGKLKQASMLDYIAKDKNKTPVDSINLKWT